MIETLALAVCVSRVAWWSPRAARWLEGAPTQLVREGRPILPAIRSERITEQELVTALRRQGLVDLAQVREAWVETNGEITVVPR